MRLAFKIALRFLTSSKGQTILISLGIAIGISVQIFIGSLIEGLQISLLNATIGNASHITVSNNEKNEPVDNYETIIADIEARYPEATKISPTLTKGAFFKVDDKTNQIVLRGFELSQADKIYQFSEKLLEDSVMPATATNEVIIGSAIAEDYGINIGENFDIITPEGTVFEALVVGFFDLKVASINQTWVIGDLAFVKEVFGYADNQVTGIEMQVAEPFDADLIADRMALEIPADGVKFDNWKVQNEQLLSGLSGQTTSSLIIQIFVVISVVLGIASVLAITVLQKSRQIGIMKAMGITDKISSQVFLFQGFMLGILGGILGILFGLGLLWSFSQFALKADGTPVVPIFINFGFIGLSGLIAVIASTLASIIPAIKSRKLSPIEVIKNG